MSKFMCWNKCMLAFNIDDNFAASDRLLYTLKEAQLWHVLKKIFSNTDYTIIISNNMLTFL